MVLKYSQFVNEAKKDKNAMVDLLVKILKDKPKIELGKSVEKDAYTIAGIKKYFDEHGMTKDNADDAMYAISNDKEFKDVKAQLKYFSAKNFGHNTSYPYHYIGLTAEEVTKVKEKIESSSKESSKEEIEKREVVKKKAVAAEKEKTAKKTEMKKKSAAATKDDKTTERKAPAKPRAKKTVTKKVTKKAEK